MDERSYRWNQVVSVSLYVEGGGNRKQLKTACRRSFGKFIQRAGGSAAISKIEACGSRGNAYNDFRRAVADGENAMLLVDAERDVTAQGPWQHLKASDNWDRPGGASDDQCHLMVQAMESWFLADRQVLEEYYGQGFQASALPQNPMVERIAKQDVLNGLRRAARNTQKDPYGKGAHSYEILERLDPAKVRQASPYADRFIKTLIS